MPCLSIVARSASITDPRLHSSTNAAIFGSFAAATAASGCSGATAQKVTPMTVSARVVKTYIRPSPTRLPAASRISWGKAKRTPTLLPIQLACIVFTRSGHPGILSRYDRSSSA